MSWQLFIDESGRFEDSQDTCVVAGVLVHARIHPGRDARVRAALEAACPGARYPHHASAARFLSGRVHATLAPPRSSSDGGEAERALAVEAATLLRRHDRQEAPRLLLAAIESGKEPDHDVYRRCDELLGAESPELAGRIKRVVERDQDRIRQVLQRSAELFDAPNSESFIVAAADDGELDDRDVADAVVDRDRYLALLTVMLERTAMLLYGRAHELWFCTAKRDINRRDVGRFPLGNANLAAAARSATSSPLLASSPQHAPRFINAGAQAYGPDVRPGLVLADFVSNRIRASLKGARDLPWSRLARNVERRVSLDVAATPRFIPSEAQLPSIASAGSARTIILNAFSGAPVDPALRPATQWARDQARSWLEAGTTWRAARGAS